MNIMIASLRFAPGHIAHLIAYYQMIHEMGHHGVLFVNEQYEKYLQNFHIPTIHSFIQAQTWKPDVILAYNSSLTNLKLALIFKKRCSLLNVIHEPFPGLKGLLQGKNISYIAKEAARDVVDFLTCRAFDKIILPSIQAEMSYLNYAKRCNSNYSVYPLIFPDLYNGPALDQRQYFSYIGLFNALHGNEDFLKLLRYAWEKNIDIPFKIATSTNIDDVMKDPVFSKMIERGQLVVKHGAPLTTEEINRHYAESVCVWNVYRKSMQSGVLGNAFMMGTPVIASRVGSFEDHVIEGENGFFVNNPNDCVQIIRIYNQCRENQEHFKTNCRAAFLENYHYTAHKESFRRVLEGAC